MLCLIYQKYVGRFVFLRNLKWSDLPECVGGVWCAIGNMPLKDTKYLLVFMYVFQGEPLSQGLFVPNKKPCNLQSISINKVAYCHKKFALQCFWRIRPAITGYLSQWCRGSPQMSLRSLVGRFRCFLKWWYPQNTPKWSFLVGKPMVVGYHHFRKPPFSGLKPSISWWR